jgi:acetylornithine aminotransferase
MTVINSTNYPILDSNIISSYAMKVTNSIGKSFLDFEAGVWCLPLGHNPIELNNVYKHQTNELTHNGYLYTSPILEEAATKILNITNIDNGDVVFLSSGSEAVEYAIQAAKKIKPNKKGCRLKGYYLSAYGNASSINQDWIEIDDSIDDIDFTQIGYFLFEPGNYSGIVKLPCKELINGIIEKIKANNGIIIIDEVTTGLGRTGKWFGYMHYDLIPDIITIGKGLGNGYPVSSVVFNTGVYTLAYNQGFRYAQSHQNDPLGAKISLKVIDLIKEKNLIPHTCEIGNTL